MSLRQLRALRELRALRLLWYWLGIVTVWVSFAVGWWIGALLR
jgi:hypothetical protein